MTLGMCAKAGAEGREREEELKRDKKKGDLPVKNNPEKLKRLL